MSGANDFSTHDPHGELLDDAHRDLSGGAVAEERGAMTLHTPDDADVSVGASADLSAPAAKSVSPGAPGGGTSSTDTGGTDPGSIDVGGGNANLHVATPYAGGTTLDALHAATDLTGMTIAHYVIGERLGGGAMAAVYRARDQILERDVALKVLLPGADPTMRERFRREARTVSVLEHPHIVRTRQVGQTAAQGIIYIAMELVLGVSLADLLEQRGRLSPGDSCRLLAPIAEALAYAHAQGIIHRDVKPSNILLQRAKAGTPHSVVLSILDEPVVPLLSDFGIARALDAPELTSAGRTIGTPAFMAPEQCAGSADIDGRADMYALGAVLYRCMVGRTPFSGSTTQILHAHVYENLMIPEDAEQPLPPRIVDVIKRAMQKEPAERFPTMELMARMLAAQADQPASQEEQPYAWSDATATMASLPVARPPSASTWRVLVPGTPVTPRGGLVPIVQPVAPVPLIPRTAPAMRPAPVSGARQRWRGNQAGIYFLGGALILLMVLLVATLFNSLLPGLAQEQEGTPTPAVVAIVGDEGEGAATPPFTPAPETDEPLATPAVAAGDDDPPPAAIANPEMTPARGPSPTPTPTIPPAASLESAWDDAQALFAERDWPLALDWLIMVRRIDEDYERLLVDDMLRTTYVGLATQAAVLDDWDEALRFLNEALKLRADDVSVMALMRATDTLRKAEGAARDDALDDLRVAHVRYAEELLEEGDACAAADHFGLTLQISPSPELLVRLNEIREACSDASALETLAEIGGSIIYSTQEGESYRIYRVGVGEDTGSALLVDNGAQPRLGPNGRTLAFYNRQNENPGLMGFDTLAGLNPGARSVDYTEYGEDARDAPPSWSPQGNQLAFTSARDGGYRVYVTAADAAQQATALTYGKDPMWHPRQDLIVYNGIDDVGGSPGLWTMLPDGSGRTRLTDNGNDQRPTWSPDGRFILFMSNGRHGNWEVYRYDTSSSEIVRLTDNSAQDGLPAVSPDGQYVAFVSDRDGYWRLYYVPIAGGEAKPLTDIRGSLASWLEHAIQWVR